MSTLKALLFAFTCALAVPVIALSQVSPQRIAVLKVDDVTSVNAKWDRCFQIAHDRGIKVSAGIIAASIEKQGTPYQEWLKKWDATGEVEFWNHGWDHKQWEEDGKKKSEFGNSGFEHQLDHLKQSQAALRAALGKDCTTFGSPFNAMDSDTAKALNEFPELRLIFAYQNAPPTQVMSGKVILPMNLRGEHDGTGKPNFLKFKEDYEKKDKPDLTFAAIQFHPMGFSEKGFEEYAAILDFLKSNGWTFMLPGEYAKTVGR